jgi:uncharacterized protein
LTYIDTSVLAAYYCPEPLSALAQKALQGTRERAISWLVEVELASAIARKARSRQMRRSDALRILTAFQSHLEEGFYTRLAVELRHYAKAREWLATFTISLRAMDALHLAVAATENCTLLTADAELAASCAGAGVSSRLIR